MQLFFIPPSGTGKAAHSFDDGILLSWRKSRPTQSHAPSKRANAVRVVRVVVAQRAGSGNIADVVRVAGVQGDTVRSYAL